MHLPAFGVRLWLTSSCLTRTRAETFYLHLLLIAQDQKKNKPIFNRAEVNVFFFYVDLLG